jgi:hypothetical protein
VRYNATFDPILRFGFSVGDSLRSPRLSFRGDTGGELTLVAAATLPPPSRIAAAGVYRVVVKEGGGGALLSCPPPHPSRHAVWPVRGAIVSMVAPRDARWR